LELAHDVATRLAKISASAESSLDGPTIEISGAVKAKSKGLTVLS